jgi:citrate lyase subunit beta / citryl-CoA lyase
MEALAGNCGPAVRSDCFIRLVTDGNPGIRINLKSKVQKLYGSSIRQLISDMLRFYELEDVAVEVDDKGALPYVIAARMEAAIRQITGSDKEYLLPVLSDNLYVTDKMARRRSRLYIPGNNPKLIINAGLYGSDGIILDLEDSVAHEKKEEARILVRNALRNNHMMGREKMVRINPMPVGLKDLEMIVNQPLNMILIPKCESAETVREADDKITQLLKMENDHIWIMPIIESAEGVNRSNEIAGASKMVAALAIGLEDYTADIGACRTPQGTESFYARSVIVNAARSAGIQPIDSVFSDFSDNESLFQAASLSKSMGFEGMGCIHPGQISIIHKAFNPNSAEIEKAKKFVWAFEKAASEGSAVVAVDSRMIDPPVVKRALATIETAIKIGLINKNWRDNYEG